MKTRVMPHPVWVKRGATNPHNYKATKITVADTAKLYVKHMSNPLLEKTANDVLNEIKLFYATQSMIKGE